jgi:uncharacterized membrane protein YecN with MAPEG domain
MPLHTAFFTALSGLLLCGLALRTTSLRIRHRIFDGYGGRADLQHVARAHGVSVEHLLPMLLMLLLLELCGASHWEVDGLGAVMLVSRLMQVFGFIAGRGRVRIQGMTLTYACEAALGISLLMLVVRTWLRS